MTAEDFKKNVLLIRINRLYHNDMTDMELYEATRARWRLNLEQTQKMEYAAAVYDGMILEIYRITAWLPAFSTFTNRSETDHAEKDLNRYEFVGTIAPENIKKRYVGKSVAGMFRHGEANPVKYIEKQIR